MHYTSRFSSYANACVNPKTFFLQEIIYHARETAKVLSLISKTSFLLWADQGMRHHPSIREKYFFNTCPVLTAVRKKNQQEMVALGKQTFGGWECIIFLKGCLFGGSDGAQVSSKVAG